LPALARARKLGEEERRGSKKARIKELLDDAPFNSNSPTGSTFTAFSTFGEGLAPPHSFLICCRKLRR
jgi:hypothetical protein